MLKEKQLGEIEVIENILMFLDDYYDTFNETVGFDEQVRDILSNYISMQTKEYKEQFTI